MQIDIVGIDPGTKNFAIVGLDAEGKLRYARFLQETISSCSAENAKQIDVYLREIRRILTQLAPTHVGAEAFVVRGFSTTLTQFVNLMLGSLWAECSRRKIKRTHISSSTWKNAIKPIGDLKKLYKFAETYKVKPHLVDAICIALYSRNGLKFVYEDRDLITRNVKRLGKMEIIGNVTVPPKRKVGRKRKVR